MAVTGLDHVNIIARDLDASAAFYAEVLGLEQRDAPSPLPPELVQWMYAPGGQAIIHLVSFRRRGPDAKMPEGPTGALDHVALACSGYEATLSRLEELGLPFRTAGVAGAGIRQIFLRDPSDVLLELNFRD
jgi:catechol 2,3-dioxygenase-like lactoylglutathione lyase family enzyme